MLILKFFIVKNLRTQFTSMYTTLRGIEKDDVGIASSSCSAAGQIGLSIGTALFNTIAVSVTSAYAIHHAVSSTSTIATAHGFKAASACDFIILLFVSMVTFLMIKAPALTQEK